MVKKLRISWDDIALENYKLSIKYIATNSLQNAQKVKNKINKSISALSANPARYSLDKYKLNNENLYRAFEVYHFRISYHWSVDEIRIVRFRHTGQFPLEY